MVAFLIRLAVLGSMLLIAFNVFAGWWRLRGVRKRAQPVRSATPEEEKAREMAEAATRRATAIRVAAARLGDREMWQAAERVAAAVDALVRAVMAAPERNRQARRYLGQILPAAAEAVQDFAKLYRAGRNPAIRREYLELTGELASAFEAASAQYLGAKTDEVLIEAEVLRDLLERAKR